MTGQIERANRAVWLLATALAAAYVVAFGVNLPVTDEWGTIGALGGQTSLVTFLFEWHNEHRLPLPRLVYLTSFRLTGDLRAGMLLTVAGLSAAARLAMLAARKLRGTASFSDAAIPLLLLNPSQSENLTMSYQVGFMLSVLLAVRATAGAVCLTGWRRFAAVAGCGVLLTMCGAHGCILAVGPLVTLAWDGWKNQLRWPSVIAAAVVAGLIGWAAINYPPPVGYRPPVTGKNLLLGVLGYGSVGYGFCAWWAWPASAVAATGLFLAGVAPLVRRAPAPVIGLVVAAFLLAAAVAWGRGPFELFAVFAPRYVPFSALIPVGLLLGWAAAGTRRSPAVLLAYVVALVPWNVAVAVRAGVHHRDLHTGVIADLNAGVPVEVVADRTHFQTLNDRVVFARVVEAYQAAGLAPFGAVRHLALHRTITLPADAIQPTDSRGWKLTIDPPQRVLAVRVHGKYANVDPWTPVRVRWSWAGRTRSDSGTRLSVTAAVLWVGGEEIGDVRFDPDDEWTPGEVEVLVAVGG